MCKLLIFGGTSEGRILAEFCAEMKIHTFISITTEYGFELLVKSEYIHPHIGKMNQDEIQSFIIEHDIRVVIDATHPYATEITKNIKNVCNLHNIINYRIIRKSDSHISNAKYFDSIHDIVSYLNTKGGNILLTTGSKNLRELCNIKDYNKRCVVRVLPNDNIIEQCEKMGFDTSQIIAEKGPFSIKQNESHLRKFNAHFLVTKDSGSIGGFMEKIIAANNCKAEVLILKRPEESGITLDTVKRFLMERYHE